MQAAHAQSVVAVTGDVHGRDRAHTPGLDRLHNAIALRASAEREYLEALAEVTIGVRATPSPATADRSEKFTVEEAAEFLKMGVSTLRATYARREIAIIRGGRRIHITRAECERYQAARTTTTRDDDARGGRR